MKQMAQTMQIQLEKCLFLFFPLLIVCTDLQFRGLTETMN